MKGRGMIHYTCDRCKRLLDPVEELRYIVKMEIQAAFDPVESCELDEDRDHLSEIHEILESSDPDDLLEEVEQRRSFDLCSECFRRFQKNPLGCELTAQFGFSNN